MGSAGGYTFIFCLGTIMADELRVGPAIQQSMCAPEFAAYSAGHRLRVE